MARSRSRSSCRPEAKASVRESGDHDRPAASNGPGVTARAGAEPSAATTKTRAGRSTVQPTWLNRYSMLLTRRGGMSLARRCSPPRPYRAGSGSRAAKASAWPSGAHSSSVIGASVPHTTSRSPPSATGRTQICDRPSSPVTANASRRPSGDHRGSCSAPGPVNGRGAAPAPRADASQIRCAYRLPSRSGSVTVKATVLPSGDTRGSPSWRTRPMSAGHMPAGESVTWLIQLLSAPSAAPCPAQITANRRRPQSGLSGGSALSSWTPGMMSSLGSKAPSAATAASS